MFWALLWILFWQTNKSQGELSFLIFLLTYYSWTREHHLSVEDTMVYFTVLILETLSLNISNIYILCSEELSSRMFISYFDLIHHSTPPKKNFNEYITFFKVTHVGNSQRTFNSCFQGAKRFTYVVWNRKQKDLVNINVSGTCHLMNEKPLSIFLPPLPNHTEASKAPFTL